MHKGISKTFCRSSFTHYQRTKYVETSRNKQKGTYTLFLCCTYMSTVRSLPTMYGLHTGEYLKCVLWAVLKMPLYLIVLIKSIHGFHISRTIRLYFQWTYRKRCSTHIRSLVAAIRIQTVTPQCHSNTNTKRRFSPLHLIVPGCIVSFLIIIKYI